MDEVKPSSMASTQEKIAKTLKKTKMKVSSAAGRTTHLVISFLSTILTLVLVFAVAVFLYATFYYAYVPVNHLKMPVNFQFEPCDSTSTASKCSFPIGEIRLDKDQKLRHGQPYSISLRLELPDNEVNESHGMFMTCVSLLGMDHWGYQSVIWKDCQSSILEFRSPLLRILETVVYSPFFLLGQSSQKQVININFLKKLVMDPRNEEEIFEVEIKSKQIQVIKADLEVQAELKGLKYLMFKHSWISATIGIGLTIGSLFVIIASSWTRFLTSDTGEAGGEEEDINCNDPDQENAESSSTNEGEEETTEDIADQPVNDGLLNRNIILRSQFIPSIPSLIFFMKCSLQLVLLFVLFTVSYHAYTHDVYEPSKLMDILSSEMFSCLQCDSDGVLQTAVEAMSSLYQAVMDWDDVFVKLFVIKIVFAVMLILIMSMTRFID